MDFSLNSILNILPLAATFPFLPAGVSFGYLFFLPWIDTDLYAQISFWPYFAMLFSIVVTASMISIIKLNNGKYIFEHFSYLAAASLLYIVAGTLFVVLQDDSEYCREGLLGSSRFKNIQTGTKDDSSVI